MKMMHQNLVPRRSTAAQEHSLHIPLVHSLLSPDTVPSRRRVTAAMNVEDDPDDDAPLGWRPPKYLNLLPAEAGAAAADAEADEDGKPRR